MHLLSMAGSTAEMLVHKQLRDLLLTQRHCLKAWKEQVEEQDMVSKNDYDVLKEQLKEEKRLHEDTKSRLASESEKLQFALGEIQVLTAQLEREKENFERSFGELKQKSVKENAKNSKLKTRFSVIEAEKEKQDEMMSLQDSRIRELKQRLAKQKDSHRQQVSELNVKLQQEAYMARTLAGRGDHRKGHTKPDK